MVQRFVLKERHVEFVRHQRRTDMARKSGVAIVRAAVMCGAGVSFLPDQYCKDQLARGELVEVYQRVWLDEAASRLSVVYPSRRLVARKTRVFLGFLDSIC